MAKPNRKKVIVTRKWLLNFADTIYNPKTKEFLNLCNGKLQNGPDPDDETRPMHCGLGELYFQVTGKQPHDTGVTEEDVIYIVAEQSSLGQKVIAEKEKIIKSLKALKVLKDLVSDLISDASDFDFIDDSRMVTFRCTLNTIPSTNDADDGISLNVYRQRSRRVAGVLRKAAKLLP